MWINKFTQVLSCMSVQATISGDPVWLALDNILISGVIFHIPLI